MTEQEIRTLVRDLAGALLDTVGSLEAAQDDFTEGQYAREMAAYDRAVTWLKEEGGKV